MSVPRGLRHLWEPALLESVAEANIERCRRCGVYARRVRGRIVPSAMYTRSDMTEWSGRQGHVRLKVCVAKAGS